MNWRIFFAVFLGVLSGQIVWDLIEEECSEDHRDHGPDPNRP